MNVLYICIDESGKASHGDIYSLVGCWFVSNRHRSSDPLEDLRDQTIDKILPGKDVAELKGAKMDNEKVNSALEYIRKKMYKSESVSQNPPVWDQSQPIRFTTSIQSPDSLSSAIQPEISRPDAPRFVKLSALDTVLTPLFTAALDCSSCQSIRILLDSTTWTNPVNMYRSAVDDLGVETTLKTHDSKEIPGIQFADIAAYSIRRDLTKGDCSSAASIINNYRLTE